MRTTRRLALPLLLVASTLLVGLPAPAADAARGPCLPGLKKPTCRIWTGKVLAVADGDTIHAKVRLRSGWSPRTKIRLLGLQAMELSDYSRARGRRGECHAVGAAERLEFLLQGRRVKRRKIRVAARHPGSTTQGPRRRLRRGVAFRQGGRWRDAGAVLVREGLAIWSPNRREWAWNRRYAKLAAQAALDGRRIWDTDACRPGPHQALPIQLKVKWDAAGTDPRNPNGEFVRITNLDPLNPLPLGRWWLRDSFLRRYTFRASTMVPAGGSIRLRVGKGRSDGSTIYWGKRDPVFENVIGGRRAIGDGAYLFDPHGDLRAWQVYPCRIGCADPLKGRVSITARKQAPEAIRVANTSNGPIDLSEYEVESVPWFYEFDRGRILAPGESILIFVGPDPRKDTQFIEGWGFDKYLLGDKKDVVTLRNRLGAPITCHAWGPGKRCPRV